MLSACVVFSRMCLSGGEASLLCCVFVVGWRCMGSLSGVGWRFVGVLLGGAGGALCDGCRGLERGHRWSVSWCFVIAVDVVEE